MIPRWFLNSLFNHFFEFNLLWNDFDFRCLKNMKFQSMKLHQDVSKKKNINLLQNIRKKNRNPRKKNINLLQNTRKKNINPKKKNINLLQNTRKKNIWNPKKKNINLLQEKREKAAFPLEKTPQPLLLPFLASTKTTAPKGKGRGTFFCQRHSFKLDKFEVEKYCFRIQLLGARSKHQRPKSFARVYKWTLC